MLFCVGSAVNIITLIVYFMALTTDAHAYVDPGSGSFIIQIVIGIFLGGVYAIKIYWKRIRVTLKNLLSRGQRVDD